MQRLIAFLSLLAPLAAHAAGAQILGSPAAVLDAIKQSRGEVLLAFIDGPADQSSPVKNFQGLLSRYDIDLNGMDLGQVRRNTLLHVRPRLGLNRLTIKNAFDDKQQKLMTFPAMRAAGVPTTILEIRTSRDFAWIEALALSQSEARAIASALKRTQAGGMRRVLALIRSRGQEVAQQPRQKKNWSRGLPSGGGFHANTNSDDSVDFEAAPIESPDSGEIIENAANEAAMKSDLPQETAGDMESEAGEANSQFNISADRRSYY